MRRVLYQCVPEAVIGVGGSAALEHQLRGDQSGDGSLQLVLRKIRYSTQQHIGKLAPYCGADLRHQPHRRQTVEPRHQRIVQGGRNSDQRDTALQDAFGQLLDKQWHADALDLDPAEVALLKEGAEQPARARGDHNRVRFGQGLEACREVWGLTDDRIPTAVAARMVRRSNTRHRFGCNRIIIAPICRNKMRLLWWFVLSGRGRAQPTGSTPSAAKYPGERTASAAGTALAGHRHLHPRAFHPADRALHRPGELPHQTMSSEERIAIMCAEAVPWRYRRSLVADALGVRGIPAVEIYPPCRRRCCNKTWNGASRTTSIQQPKAHRYIGKMATRQRNPWAALEEQFSYRPGNVIGYVHVLD
jgi:hypothetical protein